MHLSWNHTDTFYCFAEAVSSQMFSLYTLLESENQDTAMMLGADSPTPVVCTLQIVKRSCSFSGKGDLFSICIKKYVDESSPKIHYDSKKEWPRMHRVQVDATIQNGRAKEKPFNYLLTKL